MSRVFLMKWYHFTVEYFEDLRNVDHCEFLIMRNQENGKFVLENNLRTWSELRRERSAVAINANKDKDKDEVKVDRSKTAVVTRRWGGCPNGCNHTNHYKKRHDLEALRQRDIERSGLPGTNGNGSSGNSSSGNGMTIASRRQRQHHAISSDDGDDEQSDHRAAPDVEIEVTRTLEEVLSSPDGTPSFITAEDRLRALKSPHLHVGRDFGGTYSGHASIAGSDTDGSSDEAQRRHRVASINARIRSAHGGGTDDRHGDTNDRAFANRLGDADLRGSGDGPDMDDLDKAEREDRSIQGSVY